ncbi:MAG: dihydroorotase [Muribaculum sp.]|nr:dihydroorotase [Muribaculum sp.]
MTTTEIQTYMLPERYILRGGTWADSDGIRPADVEVTNGKISRITNPGEIISEGTVNFDMKGKLVTYGLCDVHVHFRQPGFEAKETIATGSRAAARGGFTTVCAMPNLNPTPDTTEHIEKEWKYIHEDAIIQVLPYASITIDRKGRELVDMKALKSLAVAFSDDGSGVQNEGMMRKAMQKAAELDVVIAAHCEDNDLLRGGYIHDGEYCNTHGHKGICSESEWGPIERDLKLAEETGCRYHVCHISTKESVELIRQAKKRGVKVTCETGPHYLVFSDEDLKDEGRFKMNPPIRSVADREALIEGIKDGTIDCIATDHAPHTADEKSRGLKGSAMGVVGLETSFGVCYTYLVKTGIITLDRLLELMCFNPRRIFRLPVEGTANFAAFDLNEEWTVNPNEFVSMGKATPFDGCQLTGKPDTLIYNGRLMKLFE